jgi:hypothetical protein
VSGNPVRGSLFSREPAAELETSEAALSLALLRIAIAPMMLWAPGFRESVRVAEWDRARWVVPEGLGWFVAHVPLGPSIATAVEVVAALAAFHAIAVSTVINRVVAFCCARRVEMVAGLRKPHPE